MKTMNYPQGNNRKGPTLPDGQRTTKTRGNGGGTYKHGPVSRADYKKAKSK